MNEIDCMIVGIENPIQLKQIIQSINNYQSNKLDFTPCGVSDVKVIDPRTWVNL